MIKDGTAQFRTHNIITKVRSQNYQMFKIIFCKYEHHENKFIHKNKFITLLFFSGRPIYYHVHFSIHVFLKDSSNELFQRSLLLHWILTWIQPMYCICSYIMCFHEYSLHLPQLCSYTMCFHEYCPSYVHTKCVFMNTG